jgi:hypothetical protein
MLVIKPYDSVGQVKFGMTAGEVVAVLGAPLRITKNRRGETSYEYEALMIRLSADSNKVAEIALTPQSGVKVEDVDADVFSSDDAFARLLQKDGSPYEYMGFIVLLGLGMTFTGFHDSDESQKAVTVFEKGRWDILRSQLNTFRPASPAA